MHQRIAPLIVALLLFPGNLWAGASLPAGVKAVWDLDKAHREKTASRERVCLNGLWRWQPGKDITATVPTDNWGHFKVPGFWPGSTSYIQEDSQTLHIHPSWKSADVRSLTAAWYQREFTVPQDWTGRRIALHAEYVNSFAIVHVDGKKAGEIRFPAGEVDLTGVCKPGNKHVLSLLVVALPLKGVLLSYTDTNSAREVKGTVERRGLCGDIHLTSTPTASRIADVKVDTSLRKGELSVSAAITGLVAEKAYTLRIQIAEKGKQIHEITSAAFKQVDLADGRINVTAKWTAPRLWDTHTPRNMLTADVSLMEEANVLDTHYPIRFGFREFWINGKDFYLNGTRIFLSAVPFDNAQIGARTASYEGARETMKRLQSFGINFIYTHNYGCQPGSHLSFTEILRAADDVGMLVGLSQPHFAHYDWKGKNADQDNGYARHAEFYVRAAQDHPSVVAYSMSHNATGYGEDMNPDLIDGLRDYHNDAWSQNNVKMAMRAEAIVKRLDPGRIVYHHSSGNLGSMHTCNFYLNFVPIQEMSDWFEHWATKGIKPVFLVEYGVPFSWDWTMYRGWYKGERSFGSAKVPWDFCLAEWNAQFFGDAAFKISEREKQNLRWEAGQFRKGNLWHRWDYPTHVGSANFDERAPVFARYITDNWRAFRTWGLSANSPWEHHTYWKLKDGVNRGRRDFKADWDKLQKPGFSPDYTHRQNWQMPTDFEMSDWIPTAAAQALIRNNQPLLGYIAGKPGSFTSKDHNYLQGEVVEKQLIVINNSREPVTCECEWTMKHAPVGRRKVPVAPGGQERIPIRLALARTIRVGSHELIATFRFDQGETQKDSLRIDVLPEPDQPEQQKIALLDPPGETGTLLSRLKVKYQRVDATADLSGYDTLIIGKNALTPDGPGPDVSRVREGMKVIVFEQSAAVLEQRFGFRVTEYGLREVFPRVPDHPALAGLKAEHLHDWRGEATLVSPRLKYTLRPRYGPTVQWCGIEVPRAWRCGSRGNVASVLIEKPARGNFLPIVDGGYSLQYSPLMEYREGKGMVLFCQLDVTGRTETDPAADALTRNLLNYAAEWKPAPTCKVVYVGEPAGKRHLEAAGLTVADYPNEPLSREQLLIVGPGGGEKLKEHADAIARWSKMGGQFLAIGLDEGETRAFLPALVNMKKEEHIAIYFEPFGMTSPFVGISPADVHNRDARILSLVTHGPTTVGNGVLARDGNVVFCQLVPWHFEPEKQMNLKRTFRRSSYLVTRLSANLGAASRVPILTRIRAPVEAGKTERRWLDGLYLDVPGEWDDPYRFFRW